MARISPSRVMSVLGTFVERPESIPLLERVQPHVAAYARIASRGSVPLHDVEDVNERDIADAISLATGDTVRSLTMLSASAPERPAR